MKPQTLNEAAAPAAQYTIELRTLANGHCGVRITPPMDQAAWQALINQPEASITEQSLVAAVTVLAGMRRQENQDWPKISNWAREHVTCCG